MVLENEWKHSKSFNDGKVERWYLQELGYADLNKNSIVRKVSNGGVLENYQLLKKTLWV